MTKTLEYRTIDKSSWGEGPWQTEVDKKQWQDQTTGLPCLLVRNEIGGHLCGYVGVGAEHPLYESSSYEEMDVHGGITFYSHCQTGPHETSICHIPSQDQPDDVWWFGFDCSHTGDISPGWKKHYTLSLGGFYKTQSFVEAQCAKLALQLLRLK